MNQSKLMNMTLILLLSCFITMMIGSCFSPKEVSQKWVSCKVVAKRFNDCRIWLDCGNSINESIDSCEIINDIWRNDILSIRLK